MTIQNCQLFKYCDVCKACTTLHTLSSHYDFNCKVRIQALQETMWFGDNYEHNSPGLISLRRRCRTHKGWPLALYIEMKLPRRACREEKLSGDYQNSKIQLCGALFMIITCLKLSELCMNRRVFQLSMPLNSR